MSTTRGSHRCTRLAVLVATMDGGGCVVESERAPGSFIRVEDDLRLDPKRLLINDRGFDVDTGAFVYGNQRGVPYDMRRVAATATDEGSLGLEGEGEGDTDLAWTLGEGSSRPAVVVT